MIWPFRKKEKRAANSRPVIVRPKVAKRSAFDAADIDELISGWAAFSQPINSQLEAELRRLRARSRQLAKNDPYLRRFFQLCKSNIVGPNGFQLRSKVIRGLGKRAGEPDELIRDIIENGWREFSRRGVCCAADRLSMVEMQNLMVDQVFRDGELVIVLEQGGKFGLKLRFIDPELMDVNHNETFGNNRVRMGVELDSRRRAVAYHFHSTDTTHENYYMIGGRGFIRIPAQYVIHRFMTEYVDQVRGYPHSTAAMLRMRYLGGYEEAELVAARTASATMGFIERGENAQGFQQLDDEESIEAIEDEEIEAEPGTFHYIDNGAKLHTWDPSHPNSAYRDYIKGVLRGIASGLGVDYNTLANDLEGVNFSSLRGGVLESRELWKCAQNWFIENVMRDIFEAWLKSALLHEALRIPSTGQPLSSAEFDRHKAHTWQPRRWAWVDPKKDLEAGVLAINNALRSRADIIREQGGDPDQVWEELAKENERLKALGITLPTETMSAQPNDEQDEEPKQ